MSKKKSYTGKYFITKLENPQIYDWGECLWADDQFLLCVTYKQGTDGREFENIWLVPVHLAKQMRWFKKFTDFYKQLDAMCNSSESIDCPVMSINEYEEIISTKQVPLWRDDGSLLDFDAHGCVEAPSFAINRLLEMAPQLPISKSLKPALRKGFEGMTCNSSCAFSVSNRLKPSNHAAFAGTPNAWVIRR